MSEGRRGWFGDEWEGRLDDWVSMVRSRRSDDDLVVDFCFPSSQLKDEYIATIKQRSEEEVTDLLRSFLFRPSAFGGDAIDHRLNYLQSKGGDPETERDRRLISWMFGTDFLNPGVRWVLDLLPHSPRHALAAIDAYVAADAWNLPDGRIWGLLHGAELIRARFIGTPETMEQHRAAFYELTPRQFEVLVHRLYEQMGYATELTRPTRDGGRDVIAARTNAGMSERVLVECKLYAGPVGVETVRALMGVVHRADANKGALLTAGHFTAGAIAESDATDRIELIDGSQLVTLLNEYLGANWTTRLDWLLSSRAGPT